MDIQEAVRQLPKTDLHCHLDGSLRPETMLEIARDEGVNLGTSDLDELKTKLVCGKKVKSLPTFLEAFGYTCAVLQSKEALERVAYELAEDAAKENVRYLEVRFAPMLATEKGLSPQEVVQSIRKGLERAEQAYPIQTNQIICALRNLPPEESVKVAKIAVELMSERVVAFDLAHAEWGNPPGEHAEAFRIAKEAGLGLTVHAGEDYGPPSIKEAIDLCQAQRIGHGRTLHQSPELEARVKDAWIPLECCPSSNVQIDLVPTFQDHPLKGYLEREVPLTLCTDNRLLTGIQVTDEYLRMMDAFSPSWEKVVEIARNGFRAAFVPESKRNEMLREFDEVVTRLNVETSE